MGMLPSHLVVDEPDVTHFKNECTALSPSQNRYLPDSLLRAMFTPGELYRRRDLHRHFGGQRQGGISTPAKAPIVLLITGDSGTRYGYRDEWSKDGFFLYTGEGQKGPMRFVSGNKAIRDHENQGKSLHLFEQERKDKRMLRYIGEMAYVSHDIQPAPDIEGKIREAIIFKLRPVGSLSPDSALLEAALAPEINSTQRRGGGFGSPEMNRRVEKAAIAAVRTEYERNGWTVTSVEADRLGYDLRCQSGEQEEHVEVKGTQGCDVCFIITAGEVRNALMDRQHVTCVVTDALTPSPSLVKIGHSEFVEFLKLEPIAFRAVLKSKRPL